MNGNKRKVKSNSPQRCSGAGRPRAQTGEDRRGAILDAALRLFAEGGARGARLARIGVAAGVTQGMIHYYFKSREGLLDAMVDERLGPLLEYIWSIEDLSDPEVILGGLLTRLQDVVGRQPYFPQLWLREIFPQGGELRERVMKRILLGKGAPVFAALRKTAAAGRIGSGLIPELLPLSAMSLLLLPLAGADFLERLPGAGKMTGDRVGRHALELILGGYAGRESLNLSGKDEAAR